MNLIFVHGWSVTSTESYGKLPQVLVKQANEAGLPLDIQHLHLSRYISFHDDVTLDDISRAMQEALEDLPGNRPGQIQPFSAIAHSTGGPVARNWVNLYYGPDRLGELPMKHLVMLAPANHGSPLAKLGKGRLGRISAWMEQVEPGQKVLDWLCMGSDGQWQLNGDYLGYDIPHEGFYPFVLTGQYTDKHFYDFINSYLIESGTDGVVRVAGANLNFRYLTLTQDRETLLDEAQPKYALSASDLRTPSPTALGVYARYAHSGEKRGIMQSISRKKDDLPLLGDLIDCLRVDSAEAYEAQALALMARTEREQQGKSTYCVLVFSLRDHRGNRLQAGQYDLILLGKDYQPDQLPRGFFVDRQMNEQTGRLVYYLNASKMRQIDQFGVRVLARPDQGFTYYAPAEFRSDGVGLADVIAPNQTTYIDIVLHRFVDKNTFRFGEVRDPAESFKDTEPNGGPINR